MAESDFKYQVVNIDTYITIKNMMYCANRTVRDRDQSAAVQRPELVEVYR